MLSCKAGLLLGGAAVGRRAKSHYREAFSFLGVIFIYFQRACRIAGHSSLQRLLVRAIPEDHALR